MRFTDRLHTPQRADLDISIQTFNDLLQELDKNKQMVFLIIGLLKFQYNQVFKFFSSFYYLKDPRHMYKMCLLGMRVYKKPSLISFSQNAIYQ